MATDARYSIEVQTSLPKEQEMETCHATFDLEGMTCASCAMRIEKGLKKVPGVKDASVNLATEQATVTYNPGQTSLEQMVQKVETVGYKATPQKPSQADVSSSQDMPAPGFMQENEQSKRKQAEIIHKRNLLIASVVLSLPV